ncbi:hypothetical protein LCGC14_1257400 [marine sediment metagenome]|uniref:Uncharacterized protein n=1 Tax=marine sediment metagenome TaxID=412755 RepID=A0A0F9P532_9ZZZZ
MSFDPPTKQTLGYLVEQPNENTDLIALSNTAHYRFGSFSLPVGDFPVKTFDVALTHRGNAYDYAFRKLKSSVVMGSIAYLPINAQPFFRALANWTSGVANVAGSVYRITPITSGKTVPFTVREVDYGASSGSYHSITGNRTKSLSVGIDLRNPSSPLAAAETFWGRDEVAPQFAGASTGLAYPGGASFNTAYRKDTNMLFAWDLNGDNVDYKDDLIDFTILFDNLNLKGMIDAQVPINNIYQGNRSISCSFTVLRGSDTSVYDDITGQTDASNLDLRFKIYQENDATEYIQLDMQQLTGITATRNFVRTTEEILPAYRINALIQNLLVDFDDGLTAGTFYGNGL